MTILNAALQLAAAGYSVFPVGSNKRPTTPHGFYDAVSDEASVRALWNDHPGSGVGVATGRVSGLVVIDVDVKNGIDGKRSLAELEVEIGPLPDTLVIGTPSGGTHLWFGVRRASVAITSIVSITGSHFAMPDVEIRSCTNLRPGIDVRGEGGYVVAPPTQLSNGSYRVTHEALIAPLPKALEAVLTTRSSSSGDRLGALLPDLALPVGQRDGALWKRACSVLGYSWERDDDHGLAAATAVLRTMWLGMQQPAGDEIPWETVLDKLRRAYEFIAAERAGTAWQIEAAAQLASAPDAIETGQGGDRAGQPRLNLIKASEARNRPPMPMLVKGLIPRRGTAALVGPSGEGKTFLSLDLALSVANGLPFLRRPVEHRGDVAYVMGEGSGDIGDRIGAWVQAHPEADGDGGLWLSEEEGLNLLDRRHVDAIVRDMPDDLALIIFDTLAAHTPGAEENSVKDMGLLVAHLRRISVETNTLVLVVHHTGWDRTRERGSSAVRAGLDTVLHLADGELKCTKQRGGAKFDPVRLTLVPIGRSVVPTVNAKPTASKKVTEEAIPDFVVRTLAENGGGMTNSALIDALRSNYGMTKARAEDVPIALSIGNDETPARIRRGKVTRLEGKFERTRDAWVLA